MTSRLTALTLTLSLATGGCVTTTAHRLPLDGNPLRAQAIACEQQCEKLRPPVHAPCESLMGHEGCTVPTGSDSDYAACLDNCPGARAKDGASCPDPAEPGVICVETTRANAGGIAGGVIGGAGVLTGILLVAAIASTPFLFFLILIAAN